MTPELSRILPWLARFILAIVSATSCSLVFAGPSVVPTGVTRYDPKAAYNCYVLFSGADPKSGAPRTFLIDMDGNIRHQWAYAGFPALMINPVLVRGNKGLVGVQLASVSPFGKLGGTGAVPGQAAGPRNKTFGIVDWDGRARWKWGDQAPEGEALQHHDWAQLRGGKVLLLTNRMGPLNGFGDRSMEDDVLYEVDPQGHIAWQWVASEHLNEFGFTPAQLTMLKESSAPDYLHMNAAQPLGRNHWAEAGDTRFAPENILISSRDANFIAIISRKSGKIVWREGPNFDTWTRPYDDLSNGTKPVPHPLDRFSGQHDPHMIPEGLPGAGNILLFDNEGEAGYPPAVMPMLSGSRVLEIDPAKNEVVWQYVGSKVSFYSSFLSSVQRLPNGNTLVDEGMDGRFFQITRSGRIVWEYVTPFRSALVPADAREPTGVPFMPKSVYRIQAVPYDWVPSGTPHAESAVMEPAKEQFYAPSPQ